MLLALYRQVEFWEKASQTTDARLCNTCNTVLVFDAATTNYFVSSKPEER